MTATKWNAQLYDNKHGFVSQYGEALISWLQPEKEEKILDLGCGTGMLANEIATAGALVTGMDASPEMIAKAKENYPSLPFFVKDATNFHFEDPFDAIFSNATLHWIHEQEALISQVRNALKSGGRFVFEMGGKENVASLTKALYASLKKEGAGQPDKTWFFPSTAAYASLLEAGGFTVTQALYFKRKTKLQGEEGMKNWFEMFAGSFLGNVTDEKKEKIIDEAVKELQPSHYRDGNWYADYVRLRMIAIKN